MRPTDFNPLEHYKKVIGSKVSTFTFKTITMSQLQIVLHRMSSTGSLGEDDISVKLIKQAQAELEPALLQLVNSTIKTVTFPQKLKTTKVIPIQKSGKEITTSEGWRPVNVVPAISKIIERVYLDQLLQHLNQNGLIGHQHHGAIKGKSTQSLITELHDILVEDNTNGQEAALIINQSKAYNLVSHKLLLKKLEIIGFQPQTLRIMKSFLENRKQYSMYKLMDLDPRTSLWAQTQWSKGVFLAVPYT